MDWVEYSLGPQDFPRTQSLPSRHLSSLRKSLGRQGCTFNVQPKTSLLSAVYVQIQDSVVRNTFDGTWFQCSCHWSGFSACADHYPLIVSPIKPCSLSDSLCSYQTMSKAICGSTSRLIDDDSPFQDRDASVQLSANDIAYWLDWPIYISYWKRCLMPLVIKLIALSGYYCLELAGQRSLGIISGASVIVFCWPAV